MSLGGRVWISIKPFSKCVKSSEDITRTIYGSTENVAGLTWRARAEMNPHTSIIKLALVLTGVAEYDYFAYKAYEFDEGQEELDDVKSLLDTIECEVDVEKISLKLGTYFKGVSHKFTIANRVAELDGELDMNNIIANNAVGDIDPINICIVFGVKSATKIDLKMIHYEKMASRIKKDLSEKLDLQSIQLQASVAQLEQPLCDQLKNLTKSVQLLAHRVAKNESTTSNTNAKAITTEGSFQKDEQSRKSQAEVEDKRIVAVMKKIEKKYAESQRSLEAKFEMKYEILANNLFLFNNGIKESAEKLKADLVANITMKMMEQHNNFSAMVAGLKNHYETQVANIQQDMATQHDQRIFELEKNIEFVKQVLESNKIHRNNQYFQEERLFDAELDIATLKKDIKNAKRNHEEVQEFTKDELKDLTVRTNSQVQEANEQTQPASKTLSDTEEEVMLSESSNSSDSSSDLGSSFERCSIFDENAAEEDSF